MYLVPVEEAYRLQLLPVEEACRLQLLPAVVFSNYMSFIDLSLDLAKCFQ